jgi:hypothetical protein
MKAAPEKITLDLTKGRDFAADFATNDVSLQGTTSTSVTLSPSPFALGCSIAVGHHFFLPRPKSEIVVTIFVVPYIPMSSAISGSPNKNYFYKCLTNRGDCIYLLRRK